ncbi:MAG: TRAP transporter TatT component family protein [Acidobacteria bacterium]|nr:TRAP transporter TatT component family protein [Acidobacteriota bacterium]
MISPVQGCIPGRPGHRREAGAGTAGAPAVAVAVLVAALALSGCSIRTMAVNAVLPTLVNPEVYLSEEDPEVVRAALPFLLKTIESIIDADPVRQDALLFANTGFLLYANAFLQADAAIAEWDDYSLAQELNERARRMYLRARDYGLRAVEIDHPGIGERLLSDPEAAVSVFDAADVETLYYLGGAWMLAISLGLDRPALVADLPSARALLDRALALDPGYSRGALHSAFITLESVGETMGGSYERAREHFDRAVELSDGLDAGPYVALATGVSVAEEKRAEFRELLETAVAIDADAEPANRLLNLVAQRRARSLLDHIDDLFFEPFDDELDADQEIRP